MKLIHKKCPNCGAGLDFDEKSIKVKCAYCNQSFVIQKDKDIREKMAKSIPIEDSYNLVKSAFKPISIIAIVIIAISIIMFIAIGIFAFNIFSNVNKGFESNNDFGFDSSFTENIYEEFEEDYITDFDQIDDKTLDIISNESLKELKGKNTYTSSYPIKENWTYVGKYLLNHKKDNYSVLYDIYKITYDVNGKDFPLYGYVRYKDLKLSEDNIVISNYNGYSYLPMYRFVDSYKWANGYESEEELYNKVIREETADYKVKATEGLYIEKVN